MKGFILVLEGEVEPNWIDENGHMNVMWYTYLFDRGSSLLFEKILTPIKSNENNTPTLVAARMHTAHRKEFLSNEHWQLWSGIAHIDSGGILFSHRLTSQSQIRAICDIQANAFDLITRRKMILTQSMIEQGQRFLVSGLSNYFVDPIGRHQGVSVS